MTYYATYGSVNLIYLGNFNSTDPHEYDYASENTSFLAGLQVDHTQMQIVQASFKDANSDGAVDDNDFGTYDKLTYDVGGGSVSNQTDGTLNANVTLQLADGSTKTVDVVMMQQDNGDLFISDLLNAGTLDNLQISGVTIDQITGTSFSGWYSDQSVDGSAIVAPEPQGDGVVEGSNTGETIDLAYTGDPEGDLIDAGDAVLGGQSGDQDVVDALGGDDSVEAGADADIVYAGSGDDTVLGEAGNDTIYGDSNFGDATTGEMVRENFEWDKIADTNGGSHVVDNGDPLDGGVTQNTGNVDVTFSVVNATSHVRTEFADNQQKVHSITDAGSGVDAYSSMASELDGDYANATYAFDFSTEVENVSFRINDIDGDGLVKVYAYNAEGNPVDLDIHAGAYLHASDQDGVGGTEVLDSIGGYEEDTSPNYSGLINIAGPVARIEVQHLENGPNNSGINITDMYYDAPVGVGDTGVAGDDSLLGGEGDDVLYGEGGNDELDGGAGNDLMYGDGPAAAGTAATGTITITGQNGLYNGALLVEIRDGDTGAVKETLTLTDDYDGNIGSSYDIPLEEGDTFRVGITSPEGTFYSDTQNALATTTSPDGSVSLAFEDTADLGNQDFNDITVDVDFAGTGATLLTDGGSVTASAPATPGDGAAGGHDLLQGGEGNDTLLGNGGDDLLYGGTDDDLIYGGNGDDQITGGQGADRLFGEAGSDSFIIENREDAFGDVIDGGTEDGDGNPTTDTENDQLDLTGLGRFEIVGNDGMTPLDLTTPNDPDGNSFSGQVNFLDANDNVEGTLTFTEVEDIIPCFTPGTAIATPKGERLVEDLQIGDRIITRDNGIQEIRWMGRRDLQGRDLLQAPHMKPVLIRAGSLGHGLPESDMVVSPNHRLLINNDRTAIYFEEREVLASAKHLTGLQGVDAVEASSVSYIHFMFDQHEVVLSNGAWTESFQPGEQTMDGMGQSQRDEIYDLFPELREAEGLGAYQAARRSLKKHETKLLVK